MGHMTAPSASDCVHHAADRPRLDGRPGRRRAAPRGLRRRDRERHAAARGGARRVARRLPPHGARGAGHAGRRGPRRPRALPGRVDRDAPGRLGARRLPRPLGAGGRRHPRLGRRRRSRSATTCAPACAPTPTPSAARAATRSSTSATSTSTSPWSVSPAARGWWRWPTTWSSSSSWPSPRWSGCAATPTTRPTPTPPWSSCSRTTTCAGAHDFLRQHLLDAEAEIVEALGMA